jgi:hypothetical protein
MSRTSIALMLALGFLTVAARAENRWPMGEVRDVDVEVSFEGSPLPESRPDNPVFPIGSNIAMKVTFYNVGVNMFNNVEAKGTLLWASNTSCTVPGPQPKTQRFSANTPLPGGISQLHEFSLASNQSISKQGNFTIPWDACPGEIYLLIEARLKPADKRNPFTPFIVPLRIHLVPANQK